MEFLLDKLKYSKTNAEFFESMNTSSHAQHGRRTASRPTTW
jgi:hypothetical protein